MSYRRSSYSSEVSFSTSVAASYSDVASVTFEVRRQGGILWALLPISCIATGEISCTYNSGTVSNFGIFSKVLRDATTIHENQKDLGVINTAGLKSSINPTAFHGYDPVVPGTYVYKLQLKSPTTGMTVAATGFRLFIAEAANR